MVKAMPRLRDSIFREISAPTRPLCRNLSAWMTRCIHALQLGLVLTFSQYAQAQGLQLSLESATVYSAQHPNGSVFTSVPFPICTNDVYNVDLRLRASWSNNYQDQLYHEPVLPLPQGTLVTSISPNPVSVPIANTSNPAQRLVDIDLGASAQTPIGLAQIAFRSRALFSGVQTTLQLPVAFKATPTGIQYETISHNALDQPTRPWLSWFLESNAEDYRVDIAHCANPTAQSSTECGGTAMSSDLGGASCTGSTYCSTTTNTFLEVAPNLSPNTPYEYRILSRNFCGITSEQNSMPVPRPFFRTAQVCFWIDEDIPDGGLLDIDRPLASTTPMDPASNLRITLHIDHPDVSDLQVSLLKTSPDRAGPVILLNTPNGPNCSLGNRVFAVVADSGSPLTDGCNPREPAIRGRVQPHQPLNAFSGKMTEGTWRLNVRDKSVNGRRGRLKEWCISTENGAIAETNPPFTAIVVPWEIPYGGSTSIATLGGEGQGAVSYSLLSGGDVCSLNGAEVSGIGIGTCTIRATKAADGVHPMQTADAEVHVTRADQQPLALAMNPSTLTYLGVGLLSTSGGSGTGAISYTIQTGAGVCSISGNQLNGTGVGQCTIVATKAGDALYNPTSSAPLIVEVGRAEQQALSIVFDPSLLHISEMSNLTTSGGSGTGAITYSIAAGSGNCEIVGQQVRGTGVGTCTVMALKAGDALYLPATTQGVLTIFSRRLSGLGIPGESLTPPFSPGVNSYVVSVPNMRDTVSVLATAEDSMAFLSLNGAPLSSGVPSGPIELVEGSNPLDVNVDAQDGSSLNYRVIVIRRIPQVIDMPEISGRILGDPPFEISASGGGSGNPVLFGSTTWSVCTVSGNEVSILTEGTCTISANQSGNAFYDPALEVARSFEVAPSADLRISKTNGRTFVDPGSVTVYQIDAVNLGPSAVFGARIFDLPPQQLSNVAWVCVPLANAGCPIGGGFGQIDVLADLPSGGGLRFEMSGIVVAPRGAVIVNTASIGVPAGVIDRDVNNNIARDVDVVDSSGILYAGFE